jgi:coenzyme F420-0:L-glutamate ligase / coenzyme F420-1:gamma-L-glutamate ligase
MLRTHIGLLDLIQSRRSIRRYKPDPIEPAVLEQVLKAAIWAPSAHNRQPWRFAVIQSQAQKDALALAMGAQLRSDLEADGVEEGVIAADVSRSYDRLTSAPVLIMVCLSMVDMDVYPDGKRAQNEYLMAVQSVAMAGQNLLLAAHDLGLSGCWMCAPLFCPDVVKTALDLPEDWQPQGVVALGYPAQEREKTRQPLETRVVWR